jgi:hypothetical protein
MSSMLPGPCRPTSATSPPAGPNWLHEIKHDGFRLLACRTGDRVRLFTRGDRRPRWTQIGNPHSFVPRNCASGDTRLAVLPCHGSDICVG